MSESTLSPARKILNESKSDSVRTAGYDDANRNWNIATIESELMAREADPKDIDVIESEDVIEAEEENVAAPIVRVSDPGGPTTDELKEHNLTHLPHRAWCPVCSKARGKEDPHYAAKKSKPDSQKPTVSFDYKSYGQEVDKDDKINCLGEV